MEIRLRKYNDVIILATNGRLDAHTAPQFSEVIQVQVDAGYSRLVVDLKRTDYLSSSGIKAIVQAAHETRQRGGDLRLANARSRVHDVLSLAGVNRIIKMYPTVVAATASYFGSGNERQASIDA